MEEESAIVKKEDRVVEVGMEGGDSVKGRIDGIGGGRGERVRRKGKG